MPSEMCFYRTKLYKACGHTEFRRFLCNPAPIHNDSLQSDIDSHGPVYIRNRFACGKQPQHVNDLELGVCGRCRKARNPNKGARRRNAVLAKEQRREQLPLSIRVFVPESDANKPKDNPEQPVTQSFLPDRCVDETKHDEKGEDVDMVPADVMGEWSLFKTEIKKTVEECRQMREEYQAAQSQIGSMLKALNNQGEHRPVGISNKPELPSTSIELKIPAQPQKAEQAATHPLPSHHSKRPLSHSATKVRRDLLAAKGRVRSMIQAINGKSEVGRMISSIDNRRMVTSMANTINRHRESDHPAKPQPPVARKKESIGRPLPPLHSRDSPALSKPEKLQILSKHRYHRLAPISEESVSQALVIANSVPDTIVLRRAKAIKVRNLNAFHCPVMKPRFGLKRKVLAPPVPRHLTPPVAVPFSKFADLGRRRVSEAEWCFVV